MCRSDYRFLFARGLAAAIVAGLLLSAGSAQALYIPYVGNVRVTPRDDKTAAIHFDVAFGLWRNEINHGATPPFRRTPGHDNGPGQFNDRRVASPAFSLTS